MNYLAHAYLSFGHPQVLVGNMISDFVKGKRQYEYERGVQAGIRLHRQIDHYTDNHPATAAAKAYFRPHYRLYSGAIVDVLYDHFLANDRSCFSREGLLSFSQQVYSTLEGAVVLMPQPFQVLLPYMKEENWLYHYKDREGMARSLRGLVRRSAYLSDADTAYQLFEEHYERLETCYRQFITDVKNFARVQLEQLLL